MFNHKPDVRLVVEVCGYQVKRLALNGIEMFFTMSDKSVSHCKKTRILLEALEATLFFSKSSMTSRLEHILREHESYLHGQKKKEISSLLQGFVVYILTDGMWQPGNPVSGVIKNFDDRLKERGPPEHPIGIQFIQFGDDPGATKMLEDLRTGCSLDRSVKVLYINKFLPLNDNFY